jgi:hypothetical protein
MKTVAVSQDYSFRVSGQAFVQYRGGVEYQRVPEAHAKAIVAANAGSIVKTATEE